MADTADLNALLRSMFEDGCETAAMVERSGLTPDAVYQRLSRMGLRRHAPQVRVAPRRRTTAKAAAAKGCTCEVSGCGREVRAGGLCNMHYQRKRTGDPAWKRPIAYRRRGTVKFGGVVLERETYEYIVRLANRRGVKVPRQASECLDWYVKSVMREEREDA